MEMQKKNDISSKFPYHAVRHEQQFIPEFEYPNMLSGHAIYSNPYSHIRKRKIANRRTNSNCTVIFPLRSPPRYPISAPLFAKQALMIRSKDVVSIAHRDDERADDRLRAYGGPGHQMALTC